MTGSIHSCMIKQNLDSEHLKYYFQTTQVAHHWDPLTIDVPNATHRTNRRLNPLESLVEIGQMVGATWEAVSGSGVSINTGHWTGAVPASRTSDWETLSGWKSYYWKFASLSCQNGFGSTVVSMELAISFDYNYQFIKNAKVAASGSTSWGQSVSVSAALALALAFES